MQKNIVIIAAASRHGGVYTIYKQFLNTLATFVQGESRLAGNQDPSAKHYVATDYKFYIFVDPQMVQPELPNVYYIPVETQGVYRFAFDLWQFKRIIKSYDVRPDVIVSFQNMGVCYDKRTPLLVYFQTVLPLLKCRWLPFKAEERTLFFYTAIYPSYVRMLLPKRADIVVQLPFMKKGLIDTLGYDERRINVLFPKLELPKEEDIEAFDFEAETYNFVYPVTPYSYKRNDLLIAAVAHLKEQQPALAKRLRLHFTFSPTDYPQFAQQAEKMGVAENVVFHGTMVFSKVLQLYKGCTACVFPSQFESFGLPLLEAAAFGLPVIVPRRPYAEEMLSGYAGIRFVENESPQAWAEAMAEQTVKQERFTPLAVSPENSWETFLRMALEKADVGAQ